MNKITPKKKNKIKITLENYPNENNFKTFHINTYSCSLLEQRTKYNKYIPGDGKL